MKEVAETGREDLKFSLLAFLRKRRVTRVPYRCGIKTAPAAVNYILGCEETLQVDDIPDPDIARKIEVVRMRILQHF